MDANQWAMIVREHGPLVWRTARRLLGDADAADTFQETFLAAWRFSETRAVRNWAALLQHLATARSLDRLRRQKVRAARQTEDGQLDRRVARSVDPLDRLQAAELAEHLRAALAVLPPRQSEIYCLRHLNDLSYEQIAGELQMSAGAVAVHLHRATRRLRKALAFLSPQLSEPLR